LYLPKQTSGGNIFTGTDETITKRKIVALQVFIHVIGKTGTDTSKVFTHPLV